LWGIEDSLRESESRWKFGDGYNPDAKDGDEDGIVQEGTKWERPLGIDL